jgi:hypothetical protein
MITVFRRRRDTRWICIVRILAGRAVMRGTGQRTEDGARIYAALLQRDIARRAVQGDLLPPAPARIRKRKAAATP